MTSRPARSPNDEAAIAWTKYTDSLEAEIERLREALEPFAVIGTRLNAAREAAMPNDVSARLLLLEGLQARHFRAAANVINQQLPNLEVDK